MKAMRKKRGRVYKGTLIFVTAMAIGVAVLWVSSYFIVYEARLALSSSTGWAFFVSYGSFEIIYIDSLEVESMFKLHFHEADFITERLWILYWKDTNWGWATMVPLWAPFLILSLWPILAVAKRHRPPPGHCIGCGYDLRGSKQSTSCPECGEPILKEAAGDAGV